MATMEQLNAILDQRTSAAVDSTDEIIGSLAAVAEAVRSIELRPGEDPRPYLAKIAQTVEGNTRALLESLGKIEEAVRAFRVPEAAITVEPPEVEVNVQAPTIDNLVADIERDDNGYMKRVRFSAAQTQAPRGPSYDLE